MSERLEEIIAERCTGLKCKKNEDGSNSFIFEFDPPIDNTTEEGREFVRELMNFIYERFTFKEYDEEDDEEED